MTADIRLTAAQVVVRLLPFLVIAWTRASLAIVLPGFIATFGLSISRAGLVVFGIEIGSFATMLGLAFVMDRFGAGRLLQWGLPILGLALLATSFTTSVVVLPIFLLLVGTGIAMSASSANTLMASTGAHRNLYLGWLHMSFSAFSVVVPLVAGYLVAAYDWQTFYQLLFLLSLLILLSYRLVEGNERVAGAVDISKARMSGGGQALRRNTTIYMGVFFLAGVQGIVMTWSYIYVIDQHQVEHGMAVIAASSVWAGVLVGRAANISASRRFPLRTILLASCVIAMVAMAGEYALSSFWTTLLCFAGVGIGVSGAFQHGTAWTLERTPDQVGAASTFVMAAAALGIAVWPWLMGLSAEAYGFASLPLVAGVGLILALLSFAATRRPEGVH